MNRFLKEGLMLVRGNGPHPFDLFDPPTNSRFPVDSQEAAILEQYISATDQRLSIFAAQSPIDDAIIRRLFERLVDSHLLSPAAIRGDLQPAPLTESMSNLDYMDEDDEESDATMVSQPPPSFLEELRSQHNQIKQGASADTSEQPAITPAQLSSAAPMLPDNAIDSFDDSTRAAINDSELATPILPVSPQEILDKGKQSVPTLKSPVDPAQVAQTQQENPITDELEAVDADDLIVEDANDSRNVAPLNALNHELGAGMSNTGPIAANPRSIQGINHIGQSEQSGQSAHNEPDALTQALDLFQQGDVTQAQVLIENILAQDPTNSTAQDYLNLIQATKIPTNDTSSNKLKFIILGSVAGVILLLLVLGFAIRRPHQIETECEFTPIALNPITAPQNGKLIFKKNFQDQKPYPKQATIFAIEGKQSDALSMLRSKKSYLLEILETMKTGGTKKQERELHSEIKKLTHQLKSCSDQKCKSDIDLQIERKKKLIYYCEYQAYAKEIAKTKEDLAALEKKISAESKPLAIKLASSAFVVPSVEKDSIVKKGDEIASQIRADSFLVTLKKKEDISEANNASIALLGKNKSAIFRGTPQKDNTIRVNDKLVSLGYTQCKAKIIFPSQSLFSSMF